MPAKRASSPTGRNGAVVEAQDLHRVYDTGTVEVAALRGASMQVARGEFLAVMGPSGCGKTTLLNVLGGLDEPTRGRVRIEGRDLQAMDDDTRTRFRAERLGFVFQSYNLLPVLSALENVTLPLAVLGVREDEARRRAMAALQAVGVEHRASHQPRELSGGEQQRVAIARALVNAPSLVFADEPTGNLDSAKGGQILQLLRELNEQRALTLVVVTHDPKVVAVAHRVLHMDSGRILRAERGGRAVRAGRRRAA